MLYRAAVVVALVSLLSLAACFDGPEISSPASEDVQPDIDAVIEGVEVACYFAGNRVADEAVTSLLARTDVQGGIERLAELGYLYDPSASVLECGIGEDGRTVKITILGFMSVEHPQDEVVYLMDFESEGKSAWVPFRYASRKELVTPDAIALDEALWAEVIEMIG